MPFFVLFMLLKSNNPERKLGAGRSEKSRQTPSHNLPDIGEQKKTMDFTHISSPLSVRTVGSDGQASTASATRKSFSSFVLLRLVLARWGRSFGESLIPADTVLEAILKAGAATAPATVRAALQRLDGAGSLSQHLDSLSASCRLTLSAGRRFSKTGFAEAEEVLKSLSIEYPIEAAWVQGLHLPAPGHSVDIMA